MYLWDHEAKTASYDSFTNVFSNDSETADNFFTVSELIKDERSQPKLYPLLDDLFMQGESYPTFNINTYDSKFINSKPQVFDFCNIDHQPE